MKTRKTTGLCFECCAKVEGRMKYCTPCATERNNRSRDVYFQQVQASIEEVRNLDSPLRLDRVVDLAIKCAF